MTKEEHKSDEKVHHKASHKVHKTVHESHDIKKKLIKKIKSIQLQRNIFLATTVILVLILLLTPVLRRTHSSSTENTNTQVSSGQTALNAILINDKRCSKCVQVISPLKQSLLTIFPDMTFKEYDYSDADAKELMSKYDIKYLPAVLLPKNIESSNNYDKVKNFVVEKDDVYDLKIGSNFDPTAEICDNDVDDNGDGNVDCDDPDCADVWYCALKPQETPDVELFVMSYCPYGLQMEKAILPVIEKLGDKVNFQLKFCNYAMHGQKELTENMRQYCIQKNAPDKLLDYLTCFIGNGGDADKCVDSVGIDADELSSCMSETDSDFSITADYNDKSKWYGNFPPFSIFDADAKKYNVAGSPTLVINGVSVQASRTPKALLDMICDAFTTKPAECDAEMSNAAPSPGFGLTGSGSSSDAQCG